MQTWASVLLSALIMVTTALRVRFPGKEIFVPENCLKNAGRLTTGKRAAMGARVRHAELATGKAQAEGRKQGISFIVTLSVLNA